MPLHDLYKKDSRGSYRLHVLREMDCQMLPPVLGSLPLGAIKEGFLPGVLESRFATLVFITMLGLVILQRAVKEHQSETAS